MVGSFAAELLGSLQDTTKTNTGDYVTSLGMIIPLPEKDLEIAPELLQHDLPDIFEIEPNTTNGKNMQIFKEISVFVLCQTDVQ